MLWILFYYPIAVIVTTIIDWKLNIFKRHAITTVKNPTEKDYFMLILKANSLEYMFFFAGFVFGSIIS